MWVPGFRVFRSKQSHFAWYRTDRKHVARNERVVPGKVQRARWVAHHTALVIFLFEVNGQACVS